MRIYISGPPNSGKSTIARAITELLEDLGVKVELRDKTTYDERWHIKQPERLVNLRGRDIQVITVQSSVRQEQDATVTPITPTLSGKPSLEEVKALAKEYGHRLIVLRRKGDPVKVQKKKQENSP